MIKNFLITFVLFISIIVSPINAKAAEQKTIDKYLEKWQEIFNLEKQIINNLNFKESSHFPFAMSPYGGAKSVTLSDNFQEPWIFTIHPYNITPYILEKISQLLRIANIPTNNIYVLSLEINGKQYIGTLEKEVKTKYLYTVNDMLRKEKSNILSQEPISYLFETEFLLKHTRELKFIVQATDKIYYYPQNKADLSYSDFEEIFQYDQKLFDKDLLLTLKTKSYNLLKQTIDPAATENIENFFNVSTLRNFSRDHCKRIHKYCLKNHLRGWDTQINKTLSLLDAISKKQLSQFLDEPAINNYQIYENYKISVLARKEQMFNYFTELYKHLDPEKKYYPIEYSDQEIESMIETLDEKESHLKTRLKETSQEKASQSNIPSGIFPEAWMLSFFQRISFIDKNTAHNAIKKLIEESKPNTEQKQTARMYISAMQG